MTPRWLLHPGDWVVDGPTLEELAWGVVYHPGGPDLWCSWKSDREVLIVPVPLIIDAILCPLGTYADEIPHLEPFLTAGEAASRYAERFQQLMAESPPPVEPDLSWISAV